MSVLRETRVPCDANPCQNGGTCLNTDDRFDCICHDGFYGETCSFVKCDINPCDNGGLCYTDAIVYRCECPEGYSGAFCEAIDVADENIL